MASSKVYLTDDSKDVAATATPGGQRYNIVSGALGTVALADGDYTFSVQSENDKLTVAIKNNTHLPSNFINASWQGFYVTASQRI